MTHLSPIENLFAVEVPPDASDFRILNFSKPPTLSYDYSIIKGDGGCQQGLIAMIDLPPGFYEILFTTKGCTEEQVRDVLGEPPYCNYVPQNLLDPNREDIWLNIIESFNSLLRANGLQPETNYLLIRRFIK